MISIRTVVVAGALALTPAIAFGQAGTPKPQFEVASVKVSPPPTGPGLFIRMGGDAGRVNYQNVTLKQVLTTAYKVKPYQVTGPAWLDSEHFDITAKVPEGVSKDLVPQMLQSLLEERFKLQVRIDKKEQSVYALVEGKGGAKLEKFDEAAEAARMEGGRGPVFRDVSGGAPGPAEGGGNQVMIARKSSGPPPPPPPPGGGGGIGGGGRGGFMSFGGGRMEARGMTLGGLADMLARLVDKPVLDMTGIQGQYNFLLEVPTEELMRGMGGVRMALGGGPPDGGPRPGGEAGPAPESTPGGSVFSAVQKFGLKLEPRKAPLDMIVIVSGEKVPTEN